MKDILELKKTSNRIHRMRCKGKIVKQQNFEEIIMENDR